MCLISLSTENLQLDKFKTVRLSLGVALTSLGQLYRLIESCGSAPHTSGSERYSLKTTEVNRKQAGFSSQVSSIDLGLAYDVGDREFESSQCL